MTLLYDIQNHFCPPQPRTFVNVVSAPLVRTVTDRKNKSLTCDLIHLPECSCWLGRLYNQSPARRQRFHQIQLAMQAVEAEVAAMAEFQNLDGFAVVHQPFSLELSVCVKWERVSATAC